MIYLGNMGLTAIPLYFRGGLTYIPYENMMSQWE